MDLDIKVPNIKIFTVKSGVGDITIEELKGKLSAISGVGRIKINNFTLMANVKLQVVPVKLSLTAISQKQSLNAKPVSAA